MKRWIPTIVLALTAAVPTPPPHFTIERIASVAGAREIAVAPNGDLFVGTSGSDVEIVPHAEATPGTPRVFARVDDAPAAGVALSSDALFVGAQFGVYRIGYRVGDARARSAPEKLASIRTSGRSSDHVTTSVAWDGRTLYASVGSSCNACAPELDSTRATIQAIDVQRHRMQLVASHIRNAIALAIEPGTRHLWAGVAGQDDLAVGHPYEIFDDVGAHVEPIDYGWPVCYEDRRETHDFPGSCARAAVPLVVFPAYETPIGAVFYPSDFKGRFAFPAVYRGGAFVTLHGSWHGPAQGLSGYVPPRVVFVPMRAGKPARTIDWSNPSAQWQSFVDGYQDGGTLARSGRPTGIAVGPEGSLFVADDEAGAIYRIRPR